MRPEDVIALMKNFQYDEVKVNNDAQPQNKVRLPHTTRDEGFCTTFEAALFAFGRLSEEGGSKLYNPDIFILRGIRSNVYVPFIQSICLYKENRTFNGIGYLQIPKGFISQSNKTKKGLIANITEILNEEDVTLQRISHINPNFSSELRRKLRDAQSENKTHEKFTSLFSSTQLPSSKTMINYKF